MKEQGITNLEVLKILDETRSFGQDSSFELNRTAKPFGKTKKLCKPELMPESLDAYRGQVRVKTLLRDTVQSALKQDKVIDHILLSGLAGSGKTTLAWLVAQEAKRAIITVTAGSIEKPLDIYNIFKEVEKEKFPIIFIDEIHGLKKQLAELLYIPMESPGTVIHFPSTYGTVNFDIAVQPFTLIGATAGEAGMLTKPLLDRFQLRLNMDAYTMPNLVSIVISTGNRLEMPLIQSVATMIAQRSSFIPRKANNLCRTIKNHIVARDISRVTPQVLNNVFELLEIDDLGIDRIGRQIMSIISECQKGSIGLKSLASMIGVDEMTLTKIYEPELVSLGLVKFMPRGRAITSLGIAYVERLERRNRT